MNRTIALLYLLLFAQASSAATLCRLVSGGGVAFGNYDIFSAAPNDTLLNIAVACDRTGGPQNIVVTMSLSQGANGTSVNARRMLNSGGAGDYLAYGLYRDVSRSSVWGFSPGIDTLSQTLAVPNNGSASVTFTIYGRLPPQQDVSAGSYSDSVQVTLSP